ncbi:MAG TPA: TIGR03084 family metal-binding protein [Iamia sp.]
MADRAAIVADLADELADLRALLADLPSDAWTRPTPAEGWTIRDQVSHLAYFNDRAVDALIAPDAFRAHVDAVFAAPADHELEDVRRGRSTTPMDLVDWWSASCSRLLEVASAPVPSPRVPWYGPEMSVASLVTARLMETWAHGQDVADAVGVVRTPTDRLRHVCHLGLRALPFSYATRGRSVPPVAVRLELVGPDGTVWSMGDPEAVEVVSGSALGFALVVTQRRHRDDTDVRAHGPVADEWVSLAQAFAGPPGPGRPPSLDPGLSVP